METKGPEHHEKGTQLSIWKVLLALFLVNVFLGIWVLISPDGKLHFLGLSIKSTPIASIFRQEEKTIVSLDTVLSSVKPLDTSLSYIDPATLKAQEEELMNTALNSPLEYPNDSAYVAMKLFFEALIETERTGKALRIIHYGDSQLEGDRITDYLRNRLQLRFGGYGPGIVMPLEPTAFMRPGLRVTQSADWEKMAIYGGLPNAPRNIYGPGAAAFRPTGAYREKIGEDTTIRRKYKITDSTLMETEDRWLYTYDSGSYELDTFVKGIYVTKENVQSWLSVKMLNSGFKRAKQFSKIRLLYSHQDGFNVSVAGNDTTVLKRVNASNAGVEALPIGKNQSDIRLYFSYGEGPLIMGLAIDGDSGVAVDNFPMRGSSALGFERINQQHLSLFFNKLNTRLIILQYGINVVPNPQKSYAYYERMLSAQLKAIKNAAPFASILVIGPSDMSRRGINGYESYPNIPMIRDAMRNAAFANNCAFWDLYKAMGGKNAMLSWVEADPPLGNKDFTHFSSAGARYVGEMLYNTLLREYVSYKKTLLP